MEYRIWYRVKPYTPCTTMTTRGAGLLDLTVWPCTASPRPLVKPSILPNGDRLPCLLPTLCKSHSLLFGLHLAIPSLFCRLCSSYSRFPLFGLLLLLCFFHQGKLGIALPSQSNLSTIQRRSGHSLKPWHPSSSSHSAISACPHSRLRLFLQPLLEDCFGDAGHRAWT